jgi:hypothetical protein
MPEIKNTIEVKIKINTDNLEKWVLHLSELLKVDDCYPTINSLEIQQIIGFVFDNNDIYEVYEIES